MPPLAAVIYMGMGRSPVLGMIVAYAGVAGGFSANIMLGMTDALAYGFTENAARMIDPNYSATMAINWYFLIASCFVLSIFGTLLTEKFMVKRFPVSKEELAKYNFDESEGKVTEEQRRGLKWAAVGFVVFVIALVAACIGDDPLFKDMASYIFMCFFIAQFTSYFAWSNLGIVMAIKGAEFLQSMQFTGAPLLVGLIFVSCIVNILIGSASAKWAILAPIFVPMLMLMGFDPAVTQVAYRIGDSITNPLSPLFPYCPVILGFVRRYAPEMGLGSVIANMVPFSVTYAVIWIIQLLVWIFLDLPLGPGGGIYL